MKIGTRGSALALWQARTVARLIAESGGPECEIVIIRTSGDERPGPPDAPVARPTPAISDDARTAVAAAVAEESSSPPNVKRMFVKEIEDALLSGAVDLAVHSAKDLPGELPEGLTIAAALEREDPRDALLLPSTVPARGFDAARRALGSHPRLGTSSVRRTASLRAQWPDATFVGIRGNVDTRLRKLDAGECDALILAAAGVRRLGLEQRLTALLPVDVSLPAPGQGIVAVEIVQQADPRIRDVVRRISDADAEAALLAERAVVQALGGGCQMPLGALATLDGQRLTIRGMVASLDGRTVVHATATGNRGGAAAVGEKLAAALIADGAGDLLK